MTRQDWVRHSIDKGPFAPGPPIEEWAAGAIVLVSVGFFVYWAYTKRREV